MADYQKMYSRLFNAITDAISNLQQVQQQTEEIYIQSADGQSAAPARGPGYDGDT